MKESRDEQLGDMASLCIDLQFNISMHRDRLSHAFICLQVVVVTISTNRRRCDSQHRSNLLQILELRQLIRTGRFSA